jgi:DNA modification methylase
VNAQILVGDVRESLRHLPDGSVRCVVTSPPYWGLRDYGHDGQIGLEQTPDEYVREMVGVFREVRRVLADDGTLWLNIGDSYAAATKGTGGNGTSSGLNCKRNADGTFHEESHASSKSGNYGGMKVDLKSSNLKPKDLVGIPWRVAFALQADGWYLRQDIIWAKPNPMPESVTDRCTKAHEYVFLLAKQPRYYYDHKAAAEPAKYAGHVVKAYKDGKNQTGQKFRDTATGGHDVEVGETRNRRSVWTVTTKPFKGAHFAVMPEALVEPCVLAGSARGDTVLDPFSGSGTVGVVALKHERNYIGCELNPEYADLSRKRICDDQPLMNSVEVITPTVGDLT